MTRDWAKPMRRDSRAYYVPEDRGFISACWVWQGANVRGYGQVAIEGRVVYVHRVLFEERHGPIPTGMQIDHLCRVHGCCNPDHLEAVTPQENTLRGIGITAVNAAKSHCVRGHALEGSNVKPKGNGAWRACRMCAVEATRAARARAATGVTT